MSWITHLNTPEPFTRVPSKEQSCRNCYYARPVKPGSDPIYMPPWMDMDIDRLPEFVDKAYELFAEQQPDKRSCRFSPPVAGKSWPKVSETDWCGYWHEADQ